MFSLDRFYNILHNNLIFPLKNGMSFYFYPFGTYQVFLVLSDTEHGQTYRTDDYTRIGIRKSLDQTKAFTHCYFFDQEPLYQFTKQIVIDSEVAAGQPIWNNGRRYRLFANSEKSEFKHQFLKERDYYDWYYFFHGFAALDWYRDFQYIRQDSFNQFDKVFICYNHLISKYRSYRLHLVSNLIAQDLTKHGYVSFFLRDEHGTWKDVIEDSTIPLDNRARVHIHNVLKDISEPLIIDTKDTTGSMSATVDIKQLTSALWHIVTETVYFLPKLHLTEKIFKPIVAKRPFILVASPGNLAYLKSYGFKTFDRWIDESYDLEEDHYIRIEKITAEIAKLCALSPVALKQMHMEMQEVLEYNFQHFYGNFKKLIVNELVDNFNGIIGRINNGREPNNHSRFHQRIDFPAGYLEEVKNRLLQ